MASQGKKTIGSVASALEVLETLGGALAPMSFTDIVTRLGRPKSSVHRMLATLVDHGFVDKPGEGGPYRLGVKLWGLGLGALGDRELLSVSRPHLERLMARSEETVDLAILLKGETSIMYMAKVDGPKSVRVNTPVGLISPSWCTATGRTMLANRRACWSRVLASPLRRLTPNTVTDPKQIRAILEKVATDGYAVARGERNVENGGIASPIRDHTGDVVAACGLALPVFRMNKLLVARSIPMVMESAAAISRALGYAPGRSARTHG